LWEYKSLLGTIIDFKLLQDINHFDKKIISDSSQQGNSQVALAIEREEILPRHLGISGNNKTLEW
jgi:hypothetical protein